MNFTRKQIFPVIMICLLFGTQIVQAQRHNRMGHADRDHLEARKIAYITDRLDLTPGEAEKFWPIYNQHKDAMKEAHKEFLTGFTGNLDSLSDEQALQNITAIENHEQQQVDLKKGFHSDLKKVLSPQKILLLIKTERDFREDLIRHLSGSGVRNDRDRR